MPADPVMQAYADRWFISHATLVRRSGAQAQQVDALLAARAAPGVVYSRAPDGAWWSALAGFAGKAPPAPPERGTDYYTPAALYWLRRALIALRDGQAPAAAAEGNRAAFAEQFARALAAEPLARDNYPAAFRDGAVDPDEAHAAALREWDAWVSGAYGVCLRVFTGESCVQKESLGRFLRTGLDAGRIKADPLATLDAIERLNAWLLPFAPFERAAGTPGLAIDRPLDALGLGCEEPYSATDAPDSLVAAPPAVALGET